MKKWIIISVVSVLILAVLGFIGWRLQAGSAEKPARTVAVTRQTVTKDISFTGTVESKQSANVSFELSGVIRDMYVAIGDTVTKGQRLALLDPQSIELELAKASADKATTTSVEYLSWEKASQDAKNTILENAKILEQKRQAVRDAKTTLDQSKEVYAKKAVENGDEASTTLATNSTVVANAAAYNSAKSTLETTLKTVVKTNSTAQQAADIAYAEYTGALPSLTATESLARVKANKSTIRAPFDGVVTAKNTNIGELTTIGTTVITIETIDNLQITANVAETDAFALSEGMSASVTFDAVSNETLEATLDQIYPAATPLDGVPTFHVVLHQKNSNTPLRSGITANITVHAAKKENVLAIPRRAIIAKSEKQFVRKQTDDQATQEIEITTGLTGSDGLVEVTSGVAEGDTIVTP
ncbi:MAG TPA: efflux RND transporter periplasmic adaptor subunit [Candidatus Andersenbacteria bacterium]|nr:efflux RND transporter periplasmic adaptor subunit [Candidatus Andersenbacteria bacterium]